MVDVVVAIAIALPWHSIFNIFINHMRNRMQLNMKEISAAEI